MVNNKVRCIVYGQQHVGKTSFILSYLNLPIQHQNISCKESFVKTEILNDQIVCLSIEKISKEEDLTNEEILKTDICILSFSVNDPISFAYIIHGKSIICKYKPEMPLIILATKSDLRNSMLKDHPCIDMSRVHLFASEIGAYAYFETSIFLNDESSLTFRQAIKIVKLVNDYNNTIKLQMVSPIQKMFSTFKNIWNKTNNMFREQIQENNHDKDDNEEEEENTIITAKHKAQNSTVEEKHDDKIKLLSTLSATNLEYIDINDTVNNLTEKETFV
ncbi:Small GTPase superfamily and Small GTPase superfamily, Rho type and P-loop containing nucleoside triphosphate hydrolase domain-containing protein [Strongyloides ratti]|uniref:Small GTPase superfamily and Small GTPase superfamily, Rho type and P-loop containing nucleoside triphosphate hydrolase domain-containing protein n=1 Tax=Strongyloides ratti TaxID=34506 RepID=A0A090LEA7_STRRB|nr:Small GTPase superfamily and Small GTPase superfamily, Rho type and P-loop containing nucleoside triphosphate hydrolase domain-containing protein [Strongyloides ratti]CEF68111.1 Small GTPase superfamily and Small GTPase superfamily, Rho type and P-loop containing nucleoside triphosphate hydrolase domain-containing protein [Strongyloides ratti]